MSILINCVYKIEMRRKVHCLLKVSSIYEVVCLFGVSLCILFASVTNLTVLCICFLLLDDIRDLNLARDGHKIVPRYFFVIKL